MFVVLSVKLKKLSQKNTAINEVSPDILPRALKATKTNENRLFRIKCKLEAGIGNMASKKPTIKKLRQQADKLFQENGLKNKPSCEVCDKPAKVVHHYTPKSVSSALRYYAPNGIPLCNGCHMRLHRSGDPEYNNKIIAKRGKFWLVDLRGERQKLVKISVKYYQDVIKKLST
ncbi:MAG: hypothetical protein UT43_C0001G0010 [Parcubacteria group bacterium GW2011_GWC1_39_29]|uniref:Uncharacterized protein n=1 Tax=Candidatus Yanofskybacteria bacterium GW2011_GWD1_39_16 TaxID=1619030 RepID=A0A837HPX0_9BACT|nr:MAG: hypothetical protein UT35_C0004G0003 [Candidatus Yanofskybacteria bacterium GW2011_GWD1_39_16]KKR15387.1 MAG: hypothetical protein UT43_C0001G0010 [Parcubacteria group bacterium GW2011_GWC1_39_29]